MMVSAGMVAVPAGVKPVRVGGMAVAVHVKVAPATLDVSVTGVEGLFEQTDWFSGELVTVGFGLTIICALMAWPWHPLAVGTMVILTVPDVLPGFVSVHPGMGLAVPVAVKPVIPPVAVALQE